MTTNQTIDGVPREHFSAWAERLERAESGFPGSVPFLKELRALLDAPAKSDYLQSCEAAHLGILKHCDLATKSQGEPVACHGDVLELLKRVRTDLTAYKGSSVELNLKTPMSDAVLRDVEAFIAEQPAPVAVVPDILPGLEYAWKHFDGLSTSQLITLQGLITLAKKGPRSAPVAMCDCNQGRIPCNGECKP